MIPVNSVESFLVSLRAAVRIFLRDNHRIAKCNRRPCLLFDKIKRLVTECGNCKPDKASKWQIVKASTRNYVKGGREPASIYDTLPEGSTIENHNEFTSKE